MRPRDTFLIYVHVACCTLAQALSIGFLGAYLLRVGFGIPAAIATGGVVLCVRFTMRSLALPLSRRMGYRGAWIVGTLVMASQYAFLPHAGVPLGLVAWMAAHATGEALYWPYVNAALTCTAADERQGRQLGTVSAIISAASVAGPLAGGLLLQFADPSWDFALAAAVMAASALPLLAMGEIPAGPVPRFLESFRSAPSLALLTFAGDGFMFGTFIYAWGIVLFLTLGENYATYGAAAAAAGLLGSVVAMVAGRGVDGGKRRTVLTVIVVTMAGGTVLKSAATWFPSTAVAANLAGTVAICFYSPVVMSMLYGMARRSGQVYRFHFATEGCFDMGGAMGCLCAAGMAAAFPSALSLSCAPAVLGIGLVAACIDRGTRPIPDPVA